MISCIAIDDEPLALRKLGDYIKRTPFLELESSCSSALEAMRVLSEKEIDLMFIDINMPDLSGMDFVKSLVRKPMIIFTTAYSEFALEGFKVDATDYLLKPFNYQDFLHAADKARLQHELFSRPLNRSEEGLQDDPDRFPGHSLHRGTKRIRPDFSGKPTTRHDTSQPESNRGTATHQPFHASASLLYRTSRQSEGSCSQPDHFRPGHLYPRGRPVQG